MFIIISVTINYISSNSLLIYLFALVLLHYYIFCYHFDWLPTESWINIASATVCHGEWNEREEREERRNEKEESQTEKNRQSDRQRENQTERQREKRREIGRRRGIGERVQWQQAVVSTGLVRFLLLSCCCFRLLIATSKKSREQLDFWDAARCEGVHCNSLVYF